jgi:hypothetical protein
LSPHKILLDALTNTIYNQLLKNNILPEEQKDYQRMSRGPAAGEQGDYIISKETSKASMYGMD